MNGHNPLAIGLLTAASVVFTVAAHPADLWKQDGVLVASSGVPTAYPSVGSGPAPRDNAVNYRNRPPRSEPSVGQVPSSTRLLQKPVVAAARAHPAVQVILPEQLLGLLDVAFERFEAKKAAVNSPSGAAIANDVETEQSRLALALVRNLISSVNQANITNDYSVLWAQMTPGVQAENSPASMAEQLKPLRDIKFDLTEALVSLPSMQSRRAEVGGVEVLVAEGEFADTSRKVVFAGEFQRQNGRWQVQNFRVDVPPLAAPAPGADTQ